MPGERFPSRGFALEINSALVLELAHCTVFNNRSGY